MTEPGSGSDRSVVAKALGRATARSACWRGECASITELAAAEKIDQS